MGNWKARLDLQAPGLHVIPGVRQYYTCTRWLQGWRLLLSQEST